MVCGHAGYVAGVYSKHTPVCGMPIQYWMVRLERSGAVQTLYAPDTTTGSGATTATRPTGLDRRAGFIRSMTLGATEANPGVQGSLRPTP